MNAAFGMAIPHLIPPLPLASFVITPPKLLKYSTFPSCFWSTTICTRDGDLEILLVFNYYLCNNFCNNNNSTDTQTKVYKVEARPTLLYGSEIWVTTRRDMTRLEAAELRFLRSVKGYTRLDKIRGEVIRKELEISGIQDVRLIYKQNWINHLERMDNTRTPKHALNYQTGGRKNRGRPRKRWQRVDSGTGQTTWSMEEDDDDDEQWQ